MNDVVNIGPWGALASLITFLGTIVGLVVWLVKANMKRQEAVTDRTFKFMEEQVKASNESHAKHADANRTMAEAVRENTNEIKGLARAVSQCAGAPQSHPGSRGR